MEIEMQPIVIDSYLCLFLIIQFLSRFCNIFLARSIVLKECYLMINFEKIHCTVFKISETL